MPLTFSHPAVVLPAKFLPERWVSMTGLIVGSVSPDFEYFIRMKVESNFSHTWLGMLWFDFPLSIILTFIYHVIVRNSFISNLPVFLRSRLSRYLNFNWLNYYKHHFFQVCICILVGIATHIFWDSFTHPHGDFVKIIPALKETTVIFGMHTTVYDLLQNISSFVGGIIVLYAILKMPRTKEFASPHHPFYYWFIVIGSGIIVANFRILTGIHYWEYYNVLTTFVSGLIMGSIIAPLFLERRVLKF
jgi:hypothetical protein